MMCCIFLAGQIVSAKSTPPVQTSSPADWSHKLLQLLGCVFCSWQWYFSNLDSPDVSAFSPEDSNICFSSLIPQMFWLMMIITKHSEYPNHLFGLFCYLLLYVSWRSWISVNDKFMNSIFLTKRHDTITVLLQPFRALVFPQASGLILLQLHKDWTFMFGKWEPEIKHLLLEAAGN